MTAKRIPGTPHPVKFSLRAKRGAGSIPVLTAYDEYITMYPATPSWYVEKSVENSSSWKIL